MRNRVTTIFLILFWLSFSLLLHDKALAPSSIRYTVQIWADGSARWKIEQVGANIGISFDAFKDNVTLLAEVASSRTGRAMGIDPNLGVTYTISGSYVIAEYRFQWLNFSKIESNTRIVVGDVFEVTDFFTRLLGDGVVTVEYPSSHKVESVAPLPYQTNASSRLLVWLGTLDFASGEPLIVFTADSTSSGVVDVLLQNALLIGSLVVLGTGLSTGLLALRRKKNRQVTAGSELLEGGPIEDDENKVSRLLRSSGGSLFQSAIADQCRFSRAKTSQLLTLLESRGIVRRYKKGRDKVVVLAESSRK